MESERSGVSNVELFRIEGKRNPVNLLWYQPRRPRGVCAVAGHGYSSSKHNLDFLCSFLASHGFSVYSLDFPGHKLGASGGELRGVDDCIDAMASGIEFARGRGEERIYTLGHSMGGMTAIFTAALDERLIGVVAIATGYGRPTSLEALTKIGVSDFRSSYVVGRPFRSSSRGSTRATTRCCPGWPDARRSSSLQIATRWSARKASASSTSERRIRNGLQRSKAITPTPPSGRAQPCCNG